MVGEIMTDWWLGRYEQMRPVYGEENTVKLHSERNNAAEIQLPERTT